MVGKTVAALLVKFAATFVASWMSLSLLAGIPLDYVVLIAMLGTAMNYVMGDLMVLPRFGNAVASLGDGLMGAMLAYAFAWVMDFSIPMISFVVLAAMIIGFEVFFHMYLEKEEDVPPRLAR